MARYTGPVCKLCRREGEQLMLKGQRCLTEKCPIKKKKGAPGPQHKKKTKLSEYGIQLREKQKIKRTYGLLEGYFRTLFIEANRMKGVTGSNMLSLLERRLDNVVYRMGFASSRSMARQLIQHGHVKVNGRRLDIASYRVREGNEVEIDTTFTENASLLESVKLSKAINSKPEWVEVDFEAKKGRVARLPKREDILMNFNEQLVVELYSK